MKSPKRAFLQQYLILVCGLILALGSSAQVFTVLHSFSSAETTSNISPNSDGAFPIGKLSLSGTNLYGTTVGGGTLGFGTVFVASTDGTSFKNLHSFTYGSDGGNPYSKLVQSGKTLFGTARGGGNSSHDGTVFALQTDGTGFTNLHIFTGIGEGIDPTSGLILSGNSLLGSTFGGGSLGRGTVFSISTQGDRFTNLANFLSNEGGNPVGGLVLASNTVYGTASYGGISNAGTVFAINTDGSEFRALYSFTGGSNGLTPYGELTLSGNSLYGTTFYGGRNSRGTIFKINTDGTGFTNLYGFSTGGYYDNVAGTAVFTNRDGANPQAGLVLSGNTLYGTTTTGGVSGSGTVFAVQTDGTDFRTLYVFTSTDPTYLTNSDGANLQGGLILSGNILYGIAADGGAGGTGTIFSIRLLPPLSLIPLGEDMVLSWPTNFTSFTLRSTTNLAAPVWTANFPAPVVVNGQYTVTNPISGTQQFFRLSQ